MRERTRTKGIFRNHINGCSGRGRCDCRYIVLHEIDGRQKSAGTFDSLDEAEDRKAELRTQKRSGQFAVVSKLTLHEYIEEWRERDARQLGIRPQTRDEYRGLLDYALNHFGPRLKSG